MEKARIKVGGTATTKEEMAERNAQGIAEEEARQAELQRVMALPFAERQKVRAERRRKAIEIHQKRHAEALEASMLPGPAENKAYMDRFQKNRDALNAERAHVGRAARPKAQPVPEVKFASQAAEDLAADEGIGPQDLRGFEPSGKTGYRTADIRAAVDARDALAEDEGDEG
jgi:hypothetical protein